MEKYYYLATIIVSLFTTATLTIGALMSITKVLRNSIENMIKARETIILENQKQLFLEYYYPLDNRLKNLNERLKQLEKK